MGANQSRSSPSLWTSAWRAETLMYTRAQQFGTSYSEAVHYLLSMYATSDVINDAKNAVRRLRQHRCTVQEYADERPSVRSSAATSSTIMN